MSHPRSTVNGMRLEQGKIEGSVVLDEDLQLQGMIVGSLTFPTAGALSSKAP